MLFSVFVWQSFGQEKAQEYLIAFLIEKSLSLDNIFIISLIFTFFKIPKEYQHKVLFWGIFGIIIFRAVLITFGLTLLASFSWVMIVLEVFLIFTGIKMLLIQDKTLDIKESFLYKYITRCFNVTDVVDSGKFYIIKQNTIYFTPLFVALVVIEFMDLVFAMDSVPAVFAVTSDPYIVYTSNIFAILGLRSLYLVLADMLERFSHLKTSLAVILIFIGSKNFAAKLFGFESFPSSWSLIIIILIITFGLVYSKKDKAI